jgi:hypothetical protein
MGLMGCKRNEKIKEKFFRRSKLKIKDKPKLLDEWTKNKMLLR